MAAAAAAMPRVELLTQGPHWILQGTDNRGKRNEHGERATPLRFTPYWNYVLHSPARNIVWPVPPDQVYRVLPGTDGIIWRAQGEPRSADRPRGIVGIGRCTRVMSVQAAQDEAVHDAAFNALFAAMRRAQPRFRGRSIVEIHLDDSCTPESIIPHETIRAHVVARGVHADRDGLDILSGPFPMGKTAEPLLGVDIGWINTQWQQLPHP